MSKILVVNNGYPSKKNPKHSGYIRSIYKNILDAGHQVDLLVLDTNHTTVSLKIWSYFHFYIKLIFYKNYRRYDYIYLHHLYYYIFPFIIIILCSRVKFICHWHGQELMPRSYVKYFIFNLFHLIVPSKIRHIVPSVFYENLLMTKLKVEAHKISVSPSGGVNTDIFCQRKSPEVHFENKVHIGFASGIDSEKGIHFVIKLISNVTSLEKQLGKVPHFHIIMYGQEKSKYKLKLDQFQSDGLITQWSVMEKKSMPSFYQSIDLLLFPTKGESLGLVALEAMSCGVPVVGPNAFAMPEYIIERESGKKYDPKEYESFQEAVIQCLKKLNQYSPRKIILSEYSKTKNILFYKSYFDGSI